RWLVSGSPPAPPPPPPASSAAPAVVSVVWSATALLVMAAALAVAGRVVALTAATTLVRPRRQHGQRDRRAGSPLGVRPDVGVTNRRPAGRKILVGGRLAAVRGRR